MYQYAARVLRVVDGDTLDAEVDLGFRVRVRVRVRLYGVDAPEVHGPTRIAGLRAAARLGELVEGRDVLLDSKCLDKYGRTVAALTIDDRDVAGVLLAEGLVVPYREKP